MLKRRMKDFIIGSPFEGAARWTHYMISRSQDAKYDRQTIAVMRRSLRTDANCIDVGAHRGKILREILKVAPNGVHHAFEPVPDSYRRLVGWYGLYSNVTLHNLALGDATGEAQFQKVISNPALSSLMPGTYDERERIEHITVKVDLLDNIVPKALPIQFIKLDVEGAELQVLRGAANTIRKKKPIVVFEHALGMSGNAITTSEDIYDFFVDSCGMSVSLMERWLMAKRPLSRDEFRNELEQRHNQYFVAYEHGSRLR